MKKATLYSDGGSRGNPGPAAIGYVLDIADGKTLTHAETIGDKTNNQAEYQALHNGLVRARSERVSWLKCYLDSELVVKQLNGDYRVKDANLRLIFEQVKMIIKKFDSVTFSHVPREKNKEADKLVNEALDKLNV